MIARVDGRSIRQEDFDRVAKPYFEQLRTQFQDGFTDDLRKIANRNVLDELIRRELLVVAARRENLEITEHDTDQILRQDPFFQNQGRFDPARFIQYKASPGSNYLNVLPKLREMAGAAKMDSLVRARATPSRAVVRSEWLKRNERVRFRFFALSLRDVSLEPEATAEERAKYYADHPEEFERKPRLRLRYLRFGLPPAGDSLRTIEERAAMDRGRMLADSVRGGASLDSIAADTAGIEDTGWLEAPPATLPGWGPVPELGELLERAAADTSARVVGPAVVQDAVFVGVITERELRRLPPLVEVLAEVKRRADTDKRRKVFEEQTRGYYADHRESYRTPRATIVRVTLAEAGLKVRPPRARDVERWYADHGRAWTGGADAEPLSGLDDSLRALVLERLIADEQTRAAARVLARVGRAWSAGKDLDRLARSSHAVVETLTIPHATLADTVFPAPFLDSLVAQTPSGAIEGPRSFGGHSVVWRLVTRDTTFVPEFEVVRTRVERDLQEERRRTEEADARAYFEEHRGEYRTPAKHVIDYISVAIPAPDSVALPEERVRAFYDSNRDRYRQEEQVRARHILIKPEPGPRGEERARARADSLLEAIRAGGDFPHLARQFSQDPGSSVAGGDLGLFARGRMVQEFSDTAFALAPGRVSEPVKTQFGYHLIRVDERRPERTQLLEEVRGGIQIELGRSLGDSISRADAEALRARLARGGSDSVLAARYGGVFTSAPFGAAEAVPQLGFVAGLAKDLESLPTGRWAPQVYKAPNGYVVVRPARLVEPTPAEFSEVQRQVVEDMKNAEKKKNLAHQVDELRARLAAGATLDSVAAPYGGLKDSGPLDRAAAFVPLLGREPQVVARAFTLAEGQVTDTLTTSQGVAWIRVEERTTPAGASYERDRRLITIELQTQNYNAWVERIRKTVKIEILRPDLREEVSATPQTVTVTPTR